MTEDTDMTAEGAPEAPTPELFSTTSTTEPPAVDAPAPAPTVVVEPPVSQPINLTLEHKATFEEIAKSDFKAAWDYLEKLWDKAIGEKD